jgi:hypothetical protein
MDPVQQEQPPPPQAASDAFRAAATAFLSTEPVASFFTHLLFLWPASCAAPRRMERAFRAIYAAFPRDLRLAQGLDHLIDLHASLPPDCVRPRRLLALLAVVVEFRDAECEGYAEGPLGELRLARNLVLWERGSFLDIMLPLMSEEERELALGVAELCDPLLLLFRRLVEDSVTVALKPRGERAWKRGPPPGRKERSDPAKRLRRAV